MEYGASTLAPTLTAAWILVAAAFCALGVVSYIAIHSRTRSVDLENAVQAFRSLDVEAFRNLVDTGEERFLHDNLSPKKFREIKRQRAWAALMYAREAGKAAAALARIGQASQRSSDAAIAAAGVQLAENAFRLRLQTIRVCLRLLDEIVFPDLQSRSLPPLMDQYERAAEALFRLRGFSRMHQLVTSKSA